VTKPETTPATAKATADKPGTKPETTPPAATATADKPGTKPETTPATATAATDKAVTKPAATPPAATATADKPVAKPETTPPATKATASEPVAKPADPKAASSEKVQQATQAEPAASAKPPAATKSEDTGQTAGSTATAKGDAPTPATPDTTATTATITEVSADAVQKATDSGKDVVIEDRTTAADKDLIEQSRKAALEAAASLQAQEPVTVKQEVVTAESTRTSADEAKSTATTAAATTSTAKTATPATTATLTTAAATTAAPAATATAAAPVKDDDDDNQIWKLLGAGGVGAIVGALIPTLGGTLVQNQGDRVIVEREGELYVHKDENLLLRRPGVTVQTEQFAGGIVRDTVHREDGSQVVTVRDAGGFVLKRTRILPDGRQIVLIDETRYGSDAPAFVNWEQTLPARRKVMPGDRYIVDSSQANRGTVRQTLMAPPVQDVGRHFTLRDVRDNERVRALMPRIDLDAVQFALGSSAIEPSQAAALNVVGTSMANVIAENPREMFLIEGHTDAVGSNLMNLALSDRRAEAVALALTEYFAIPPENLIVQGYGERYLKVDTQAASQANRRATVRRITPLIDQVAAVRF
jgi:outer membrane protein OmpA-like peptidoglycan-associated protein